MFFFLHNILCVYSDRVLGDCCDLCINIDITSMATRYNKRVVECRLGVLIMGKSLNVQAKTLKELQGSLAVGFDQMIAHVNQYILQDEYTRPDIESILGANLTDLLADIPHSSVVIELSLIHI